MTDSYDRGPLTLALPKGRLFEQVREDFAQRGLSFTFEKRKLVARDDSGLLEIFLVKNSDLPTYVNHGIAGLGVCGDDVLYESNLRFFRLHKFDFGGTKMCLAGRKDEIAHSKEIGGELLPVELSRSLTVATKFPRFTREYFHSRNVSVRIIKLNGSVELAPILGLAPYIVDLVETGNTLKANKLEIVEKLGDIDVHLIANPSYYKLRYRAIRKLVEKLTGGRK